MLYSASLATSQISVVASSRTLTYPAVTGLVSQYKLNGDATDSLNTYNGTATATVIFGRRNYVKNPSFEAGNTTGWSTDLKVGGAVAILSTDGAFGTKCLQITTPTSGGDFALWLNIPVIGGKKYIVSCYVKLGTMTASGAPYLWIRETGGVTTTSALTFSSLSTTQWTRVSFVATMGAAITACDFGFRCSPDGANGTILVDAFQVEIGSALTSYIDGSLGTGYSWSGAANNSASNYTLDKGTEFDGGGSTYINCTDIDALDTGDISISFWITGTGCVVGKHYQNFELTITSTKFSGYIGQNFGAFWYSLGESATQITHDQDTTKNSHYVYVLKYSTNQVLFYAGGQYKGVVSVPNMEHHTVSQAFLLGVRTAGAVSPAPFYGTMYNVGTYNVALTLADIVSLYNRGPEAGGQQTIIPIEPVAVSATINNYVGALT